MPLPGQVQDAISSVPGFDCDAVLSADLARQFFSQGYKFCLRYLSRAQAAQNLTVQEATGILNSGLALMAVQHARAPGWSPDASLGQQDGQEAATNAKAIGFPSGVCLWCDLEGVNASAQARDVIDYARAWYQAVHAAGYSPALYVGAGTLLSGQQLFDLPFQHYWRSSSHVPDIPKRGYQLLQFSPAIQLNGIAIDLDVALLDTERGSAQWLRESPAPP
jgi:glycoside hydrolase-like protein